MSKGVFEGLRVADFSWVATGPQVSRELAEHGATVVRVESHTSLDAARLMPPFKDFRAGVDRSAFAASFNTGKYGISLNLNTSRGREVAHRLVAWADIVGESMRPGAIARLDLDYEHCRKIKPDIIYYSACLHGQYGPHAQYGGYGGQASAIAGVTNLTGWPDSEPTGVFGAYTDFISPFYLLTTILAALDWRSRTGEGCYLELSQLEVGGALLAPAILDYGVNKRIACRDGNRHPSASPHGVFKCHGEDRWVAIAVFDDAQWLALRKAMGEPLWACEARLDTFSNRKATEDELERLIGEWTATLKAEDVMEMLQDAGVCAGLVATAEDLFADPQLAYRQHFRALEHKVIGKHHYNAPAYSLSKTPCELKKSAPVLGEDNEYVFREILGLGDDEISDMLVEGVITTEANLS